MFLDQILTNFSPAFVRSSAVQIIPLSLKFCFASGFEIRGYIAVIFNDEFFNQR
ncbi:hypothetical protein DAMNIGENAA_24420 [Desulforhabdus amnigena]|uniref:Uncharacterized protein n=1 Tax=Desulforhabdus amnigena TaxID=40218 RepID=A0A9W6L8T4_9BACT|nr:hypothetical protein DAMNIGENAA_24420 [Desulforhabdus amnigena]